jgi:DNA-binding NtrC family response regulator
MRGLQGDPMAEFHGRAAWREDSFDERASRSYALPGGRDRQPSRDPIHLDTRARGGSATTRPLPADGSDAPTRFIGESVRLRGALKVARQVADSTATVLVQGESGTGKEMLARIIHENSGRARGPFVAVNCPAMQAKILRVLQEGEIERVGGDRAIPVDVRIVAATNRDLSTEVDAGRFREDLYYRLAVVVVHLPPLRERGDDVELLARHYVVHFARKHGRAVHEMADETVTLLRSHPWPGNIRQLRNVVERALLMAEGPVLLPEHLPNEVRLGQARPGQAPTYGSDGELLPLREVEHLHIRRALALTGGNLGHTAELLGIHRNTLRQKLRRLHGEGDGDDE